MAKQVEVDGDLLVNGTIKLKATVGKIDTTLFNLIYPVGSYYWTSDDNFSPSTSFGGTWEKITDTMLMAKGSSFTADGGNADGTITLLEDQLPEHTHTMAHTHGVTGSTDEQGSHSHWMQHAHNMAHTHSGTTYGGGGHGHSLLTLTSNWRREGWDTLYAPNSDSSRAGLYSLVYMTGTDNYRDIYKNHQDPNFGRESGDSGYSYYGNWGARRNDNYKRPIIEEVSNHSHSFKTGQPVNASTSNNTGNSPDWTWSSGAHTHSVTGSTGDATNSTTSSVGKGTAINIMPPYKVAYCWHRTA